MTIIRIVTSIITVDNAFTSGVTPVFTIEKIFNGKVVLPGPLVKKLITTSSIDNLCVLYGSFHAVTLSAVALDSNQMAKIFLV